jgi:hypothetical protein
VEDGLLAFDHVYLYRKLRLPDQLRLDVHKLSRWGGRPPTAWGVSREWGVPAWEVRSAGR